MNVFFNCQLYPLIVTHYRQNSVTKTPCERSHSRISFFILYSYSKDT